MAIDAGQTGIRTLLNTREGQYREEFHGIRTDEPLIAQLAEIVARVHTTLDTPIPTLSAGVSGLTKDQTDPDHLQQATARFGVTDVYLAHDSVTSYLGALGDQRGAVIAAGTGVVTLAVGAETVARVDGWGNLIGDAGSGYWIGRAALEAVMRAHDGRGTPTALTAIMHQEFPDIEHAYIELQADPGRVRRIAAYARHVTDLANTDPVANTICHAAATELAHSVATSLRTVGEDHTPTPTVCGIGGVLTSKIIHHHFTTQLTTIWPTIQLPTAHATSLHGVALLPHLDASSALHQLVAKTIHRDPWAGRLATLPSGGAGYGR